MSPWMLPFVVQFCLVSSTTTTTSAMMRSLIMDLHRRPAVAAADAARRTSKLFSKKTTTATAMDETTTNAPPRLSGSITAEEIRDISSGIRSRFLAVVRGIEEQQNFDFSSSDNNNNNNNKLSPSLWHETFGKLSGALGEAAEASAPATLPSMTHRDAEARAASTRAKDELKLLFDGAFGRPELYRVLSSVAAAQQQQQGVDESDNNNKISDSDKHFTSVLLSLFVRNGCNLPGGDDRSNLQEMRQRIEENCSAFASAINENTDVLEFTDRELEGVSGDLLPPSNNGEKRKIPLKAPFTSPVLQFAKNPGTRKAVAVALAKKCQEENTQRFLDTLHLRHECATLLGHASHAHYMLESKMAQTPERAERFLLDLVDKLRDQRDKDLSILRNLKQKEVQEEKGFATADAAVAEQQQQQELQPWDVSYYIRAHKATLGVDEGELRKYFSLDHVKNEILSIYEELLGLKFRRVDDAEVWHPDVECYAVLSSSAKEEEEEDPRRDSDNVLGYFYFDLFPREGKYSHQCVYPLRPSYNLPGNNNDDDENNNNRNHRRRRMKPACVNIGNLSRGGQQSGESLLRFAEVQTFFHEFGHVMHCVLSESEHSLQAWAWSAVPWPGGVEQDFLEVPSMMLENFVWQPEILRRLSKKRMEDGSASSLPEETIEALCASRNAMEGYSRCRYLAMSLYDLKVHGSSGPLYEYKGREYDAVSLYGAIVSDISGIPTMPSTFPVASWYHPMMGYDAGYYSYIWSETIAADLFSEFVVENNNNINDTDADSSSPSVLLDASLGRKYRETILSPCATADGESMVRNFLGRKSSNEPFLRRLMENSAPLPTTTTRH